MKNSKKKFVSAIAALSTLSTIAAPVSTVLAAEQTLDSLVQQAIDTQSFADFQNAYAAATKATGDAQATALAKLTPLANKWFADTRVSDLVSKIEAYAKNPNGKDYDAIEAAIVAAKFDAIDDSYFRGELVKWAKGLVWTTEYSDAIAKIIAAANSKTAADIQAAKDAIAKVARTADVDYLTEQLADVTPAVQGLSVDSVSAINTASEVIVATLDGATGVAANSTLKVTLSETLDSATVNVNNVKLVKATDNVPVATAAPVLSSDKKSISVSPIAGTAFDKNTQYKLILKADIKNADGSKSLESDKTVATFTTANKASLVNFQNDTEANVAYSGNIVAGDVGTNDEVYLIFSDNIDPTSVTTSNVRLKDVTDSTADYESVSLSVAPAAYTGTPSNVVGVNINNASGLTAGDTYEVTFTGLRTANGGDVVSGKYRFVAAGTAPAVSSLITSNNVNMNNAAADTGWGKITNGTLQDGTIEAGVKFYVAFNTDIDQSTLDAVTLVKSSDGTVVDVTKDYDATFKRLTLTPKADLEENTGYQVKISTSLKSTAGVAYAAATASDTYTTLDLTRPTVVSVTDTAHNFTSLPVGQPTTFAINFSEAVTEYDVAAGTTNAFNATAGAAFANNASVLVKNLTGNAAMTSLPTMRTSTDGKTLYITVTPSAGEENRTFQVSLNSKDGTNAYIADATNATDAQKNSIASDYSFTFTTEGADTAAPTVEKIMSRSVADGYSYTGTALANGAKNVDETKDLYVLLSEYMGGASTDKIKVSAVASSTDNVQLYTKAVGASYVQTNLAATSGSNGAGAGYVRVYNDNINRKSYLVIPAADLAADTQYKLVLSPSATANGLEDIAGNDIAADYSFEFATGGTLAWNSNAAGTAMTAGFRTTLTNQINAGAGNTAGQLVTGANMYNAVAGLGVQTNDVLAVEMSDGSFYFEQATVGAGNNTTGATNLLNANLPTGLVFAPAGGTVVNMTDRGASFAQLETLTTSVSDPIAIKLTAAAGAHVDESTVTSATVKLVKVSDGSVVPATVTYRTIGANTYVSINPTADLANSTTYEVQVSGVKDLIGNTITDTKSRLITPAAATPDLAITSVTPAEGTTGVAVNAPVTIKFNSSPDAGMTLVNVAPALAGEVAVFDVTANAYMAPTDFSLAQNGDTVTLTPESFLQEGHLYRVEISRLTNNSTNVALDATANKTYTFMTETTASVSPKIQSALYVDANGSGTVNAGDIIVLTLNTDNDGTAFNFAAATQATHITLSNGGRLADGTADATISQGADRRTITVTLGTNPILVPTVTSISLAAPTGDGVTANTVTFSTDAVTITK